MRKEIIHNILESFSVYISKMLLGIIKKTNGMLQLTINYKIHE